jgi:hypothetical protein
MTVTLHPGWKLQADKDGVVIGNGAACVNSTLAGRKAQDSQWTGPWGSPPPTRTGPTSRTRSTAWHRRQRVPDRPDAGYADSGRSRLVRGGFVEVGDRTPIYREPQLSCVDQNNPTVPGLAKTLAAASWRDEGPYVIDSKR